MKVGQLTAQVSRRSAGVWSVVEAISEALIRLDDMSVTTFGLAAADTHQICAASTSQIVTRRVLGPDVIGYAPGLAGAVRSAGLDVLHAHGIWMYPSILGMAWRKRTKRVHVISPHGMLDPWALRNSGWKKRLASSLFESRHLTAADCIHALCLSELQAIRAYGLTNPVAVIPNGVDLPDPSRSYPAPWADSRASGKRILLYLGRIHPKKGIVNLLHGIAFIKTSHPSAFQEWHVVIVGWDQDGHATELRNMAASLGILEHVTFEGALYGEAKAAAFAHSDAFILPSHSEGLPMVVLEAWSHGLPVVMTPECHLPEGAMAGAAIEVAASTEGVADGLSALMALGQDELTKMGVCGRRLVEQRYTWQNVAENMRDVYRWLLAGGTPPSSVVID